MKFRDNIKGWGNKFSGRRAKFLARLLNTTYEINEDGFISYIERNVSFSKVTDNKSIYYDSSEESELDSLFKSDLSNQEVLRSRNLINLYKQNLVSKYNSEREYTGDLPNSYILLLDQVYGDLSIKYGMADSGTFEEMLRSAMIDYPNHKIVIKIHPDVFAKNKRGYFDIRELVKNPRIKVITENCHPVRLICAAEAVYTVTSQIGFEALIWGKKVKCFGMPFYAGRGLTDDYIKAPKFKRKLNLEQLVFATLVKYSSYINPETNKYTEAEKIIKYVGFQRKIRSRYPDIIFAYGFSHWKKPILKTFTQGSKLVFVKHLKDVPENSTLLVWGSTECKELHSSIKLIRVEDGFIRSVGLGGDLITPQSWVFDDVGIYYDSTKPSNLENILNYTKFNPEELKRAANLIQKLINNRISKYNLGDAQLEINNSGKPIILVVGQVEKDASIHFGTRDIKTNLKLLQVVRKKFPKACIVYKPHPDVVAGIRKKGFGETLEGNYYDIRVESGDALALFNSVDSVHTMTSLVGFEALLRNKKVYTYGTPFYSGWGLTVDAVKNPRRSRLLTIEELIAGTLIHYPIYISETSKMYTSPERVIEELIEFKNKGIQKMPIWRKFLRDLIKIWTHSGLRPNA